MRIAFRAARAAVRILGAAANDRMIGLGDQFVEQPRPQLPALKMGLAAAIGSPANTNAAELHRGGPPKRKPRECWTLMAAW